jgi:hypothetical protein
MTARATSLVLNLDGTDDIDALESLTLFDTDDSDAFSLNTRVGEPATPAAKLVFDFIDGCTSAKTYSGCRAV